MDSKDENIHQIKEDHDDKESIKIDDNSSDENKQNLLSHHLNRNLVLNTKENIYNLYKPVIYEIEQYCGNLKNSQTILNKQLEDFFQLLRDLKFKLENDKLAEQLDENAKKIITIKRKLTLIHTIIQNSDDRCKRLIAKYSTTNTSTLSSKDNETSNLIIRDRI